MQDSFNVNGETITVWPEDLKMERRGDDMIRSVRFTDTEKYHADITNMILTLETEGEEGVKYFRGGCGTKFYHMDAWGLPAMDLLHARALALYQHALEVDSAVPDLAWVNLYRKGDYCMPHSHVRSTASIVYMLETGDEDPQDELSGRFCIVDPRLEACCQEQEDCMTTPFVPGLEPGDMIIFPSQVVHGVNPYTGNRPRITLSWNINSFALPGDPLEGAPSE